MLSDIERFFFRHPEVTEKDCLMEEIRRRAEGDYITTGAVQDVLGETLTDQLTTKTFDRRS